MSSSRRRRPLLLLLLLPAMLAPSPAGAARDETPAQKEEAAKASGTPDVPADLAPRFRDFLELSSPLMSERERQVFLELKQDYQRDAFMRRFWEVRDPFPQTPKNEFADRWLERAKLARERFHNLADDRARLLMLNGEPRQTVPGRCPGILLPLEIWIYSQSELVRGDFTLVFYSPSGSPSGPFRLWHRSPGLDPLLSIEARVHGPDASIVNDINENCQRGDDIVGGLDGAIEWDKVEAAVLPKTGEEGVGGFVSYSTDLP